VTHDWITFGVAGVGVVGSLSGVIVGQQVSQSWQRDQWVLDRRTQEFRELLDALADSLRASLMMYAGAILEPEKQRDIVETQANTMRVIRSRIFVIEEVVRLNIELRWGNALNRHRQDLDIEKLANVFNELRLEIVKAARPIPSRPVRSRLRWILRHRRSNGGQPGVSSGGRQADRLGM